MRSSDRYRKYDKKNIQLDVQENNISWDFETKKHHTQPRFPIFFDEIPNESEKQRFERYIRQLGRAILSCSLCDRGISFLKYKNNIRDPHFQPSINHNDIAIIKYQPEVHDINGLIDFDLQNKLYVTSVIKCHGNDECMCPYFDLEIKALSKCWPKFWIILDKMSANYLNINWHVGEIQESQNFKYYCCNIDDKYYKTIVKAIINPQVRKRLLTS